MQETVLQPSVSEPGSPAAGAHPGRPAVQGEAAQQGHRVAPGTISSPDLLPKQLKKKPCVFSILMFKARQEAPQLLSFTALCLPKHLLPQSRACLVCKIRLYRIISCPAGEK